MQTVRILYCKVIIDFIGAHTRSTCISTRTQGRQVWAVHLLFWILSLGHTRAYDHAATCVRPVTW